MFLPFLSLFRVPQLFFQPISKILLQVEDCEVMGFEGSVADVPRKLNTASFPVVAVLDNLNPYQGLKPPPLSGSTFARTPPRIGIRPSLGMKRPSKAQFLSQRQKCIRQIERMLHLSNLAGHTSPR